MWCFGQYVWMVYVVCSILLPIAIATLSVVENWKINFITTSYYNEYTGDIGNKRLLIGSDPYLDQILIDFKIPKTRVWLIQEFHRWSDCEPWSDQEVYHLEWSDWMVWIRSQVRSERIILDHIINDQWKIFYKRNYFIVFVHCWFYFWLVKKWRKWKS